MLGKDLKQVHFGNLGPMLKLLLPLHKALSS